MKPLLYYDPLFLEHQTGSHPECPDRLQAIWSHFQANGLIERGERVEWTAADEGRLTLVHDAAYAAALRRAAEKGGGRVEVDTVISRRSDDAARRAAGAVCDAVERVVRGQAKQALCLVRPPGHHALHDEPMGFCLYNSIAIGARVAVKELELDRALIVDWDVHHGNGTQDAFYRDPQVGFFSMHRHPFYPGTGAADETGAGPGLGTTRNMPVAFGTPRKAQLDRFAVELEKFADKIRPQIVLVSAGFDSHRLDPVGSLGLEAEDFALLTGTVRAVADAHAQGRLVCVLEGGYSLEALPKCVEEHWMRLG